MSSMIDAQCRKCGRRFGWAGSMTNMPACPRCGYRPPQSDLDAGEAEMEAFRKLLRSRPQASVIARRRVAAGLSLRQAAKLLGVTPQMLGDCEHGRRELSAEIALKMIEVYGLDPE